MKYLTLIDSIALLHQYQREVKSTTAGGEIIEYIEVTKKDIEVADRLAASLLGRSLDELPPQTRKLWEQIQKMTKASAVRLAVDLAEVRFSRRELRDLTGWGQTQLRVHLSRLVEMEYLAPFRGPRNQILYQICEYDGDLAGQNASWRGGCGLGAGQKPQGETSPFIRNNTELGNREPTWRPARERTSGSKIAAVVP